MHKTNTYISNDCTRKCIVYTDANGHFHVRRYMNTVELVRKGREKFKQYESMRRASLKWVNNK